MDHFSPVKETKRWGSSSSFWVEYPSGLVDLSRPALSSAILPNSEPPLQHGQAEFSVNGKRKARIDPKKSALVVVDMQNFFLHPEIMPHPTGLACVDPLMKVIPILREWGVKIIWLNWGLTPEEERTLPPAVKRTFTTLTPLGPGSFGSDLGPKFGKMLMRGEVNADLYGPLKGEWEKGQKAGTDVWIHKNRISGLWGAETALNLYLKEQGIDTLFFSGVNADQCVNGTMVDASFKGYDCIVIQDTTATTSPEGAVDNVLHNCALYAGFVTDSKEIAVAQVKL